mmetsp:Transcript_11175/g.25894  ORF Transcript_11175/g.25894 Transcript_11175/m.25894 type:complete len:123 (-) Transcript_11175:161-529(-)
MRCSRFLRSKPTLHAVARKPSAVAAVSRPTPSSTKKTSSRMAITVVPLSTKPPKNNGLHEIVPFVRVFVRDCTLHLSFNEWVTRDQLSRQPVFVFGHSSFQNASGGCLAGQFSTRFDCKAHQ